MSEFPTDVPGVHADSIEDYGLNQYPVFHVDADTFHQRLEMDDNPGQNSRRRLSPPEDSNLAKYLNNTQINNPFIIRYNDGENIYDKKVR